MSQPEAKPIPETDFPRCGDIYEVNLDPVVGPETGKRRPGLIVSNDINNEYSPTVTVLPLTGQPAQKQYPFEVLVPKGVAGLTVDSRIKANQIRTVDKRRLVSFKGSLPSPYLPQVEKALKIHLNLK
ncbi:type II toxin-antitoxin system PemK/MazF family toxin [Candidatus Hakubella thermalkaliphila]|uniref:mRNA interferase n=1 Tax=Candidatus Hakubella thermalkaliphila TaxID=2754717 RepID=A0A6V8QFV4_9ACTN|nr:type II toxin-antitoxin system PemK/MazF family toxin [Candidatus Hakubella thermalkaliphila]GFP28962.1 mRNA interferase MazF [Candidatus Hakubella thermalkaliphila]GFP43623.1 mRNA interferase MazF [Candidatus Hakubella thermalkaliphila]